MRRAIIAALSLSLVLVGSARPAGASATPLPEDAIIHFAGHGWGHGRGMGQYGAEGMAKRGVLYQDILKHYYAGISFEKRQPESVRVLLQTYADVLVTSAAPLTAWTGSTQLASSSSALPYLRSTQSGGTYTLWSGASSSRASTWTKVTTTTSAIVFKPGPQMLQLVVASGTFRYYRGSVQALASGTSSLQAIDIVPLEAYLAGVVPREMPASWEPEALKSQAVAARSYTINKKIRATSMSYDICITTACQSYGGYAYKSSATATPTILESNASTAAVNATVGQVMMVSGTPILAEYSSTTGGYTAPGTVSYEAPVPDPDDAISPLHDWSASVSVSAIEKHWPSIGRLVSLDVAKRNGYGDWGGRVVTMNVVGTSATETVGGGTFAAAFPWPGLSDGLVSGWFWVQTWNAALAQTPEVPPVLPGQNLPMRILLKNTGTTSWPLGSFVRIAAASSSLSGSEWISPTRPAAVSKDVTSSARTSVPPGDVGEVDFTLHTSSLAPGNYSQRFSVVADGVTAMNPSFTIPFTVAPPHTTLGIVNGNLWSLDKTFGSSPDIVFKFGLADDTKIVGDWDGNGSFTPGAVRGNVWYLNNGYDGTADIVFRYGIRGDISIVGDWDGNGTYTPGVIRGNTWYLRNSNSSGPADLVFKFGLASDHFITGDWNGDGSSTPGVIRGNTFSLRNSDSNGPADTTFTWGLTTDRFVVGDWDGNHTWTPGIVRGSTWYLSNVVGQTADTVSYGDGSGDPVVGSWGN